MSLKFDVREDMGGYGLHIDTAQTNIEVGATESELRRLMVDLVHAFDFGDTVTGTDGDPDDADGDEGADALYYGRCDTCSGVLREVGRVVVRAAPEGNIRFRFCSGACRAAFDTRDDRTAIPPDPTTDDGEEGA